MIGDNCSLTLHNSVTTVLVCRLDGKKCVFYEGHKEQDSIRLGGDCPFCFLCSTGPVIQPNLSVTVGESFTQMNQMRLVFFVCKSQGDRTAIMNSKSCGEMNLLTDTDIPQYVYFFTWLLRISSTTATTAQCYTKRIRFWCGVRHFLHLLLWCLQDILNLKVAVY